MKRLNHPLKSKKTTVFSSICFSLLLAAGAISAHENTKTEKAPVEDQKLAKIIASQHRTAEFASRDIYRHPLETLSFFGIKDTMTVVEISPGSGWYTEILAPYLKDNGQYIAAGYDPQSSNDYYKNGAKKFQAKLDSNSELYGKTVLGIMQAPDKFEFAKDDSVDMILSFRNTHNWHSSGNSEAVYAAIFKALKTGGTFGLVQHRAGHVFPEDSSGKKGYLKQSEIIKLAEKVGFKLLAKSDINANPKDTRDHPKGVWNLPPSLASKEVDKEKYMAIGESDRMTLKFVKPHQI